MTRHRRRTPRPAGLALDQVRSRLAPDTLLAAVQSRWADAVGPAVAAQALPTSERSGVLTVSCAASVWAHELDLMGPVIVQRLNELLGADRVVRLRCIATPPGV